jgi:hypothetical protein
MSNGWFENHYGSVFKFQSVCQLYRLKDGNLIEGVSVGLNLSNKLPAFNL